MFKEWAVLCPLLCEFPVGKNECPLFSLSFQSYGIGEITAHAKCTSGKVKTHLFLYIFSTTANVKAPTGNRLNHRMCYMMILMVE